MVLKIERCDCINCKGMHEFMCIGNTGCGKSTVLSLIERFYDVIDGEVV